MNQLFNNVFDSKDPWGHDLPPELEGRAGEANLPNDLFVVVWGIMADMEYHQVELGTPHHANLVVRLQGESALAQAHLQGSVCIQASCELYLRLDTWTFSS